MGTGEVREALAEHLPWTGTGATIKAPGLQPEGHHHAAKRDVGQGAPVPAMDAMTQAPADGAGSTTAAGTQDEGGLTGEAVHSIKRQAMELREDRGQAHQGLQDRQTRKRPSSGVPEAAGGGVGLHQLWARPYFRVAITSWAGNGGWATHDTFKDGHSTDSSVYSWDETTGNSTQGACGFLVLGGILGIPYTVEASGFTFNSGNAPWA